MGLKGNCPYKRKKGGVWEESQYQTQEGMRGQGWVGDSSQGRGGAKEGLLPSCDLPTPNPIHPTSPIPPESYVQRNTEKLWTWREGGRWREIGEGGMMRGKPSPVLPPPGDRVMEGGPQHPSSNTGPPTLGERDMAFPRVSFPLPLGVETKKREGRGSGAVCVRVGQIN